VIRMIAWRIWDEGRTDDHAIHNIWRPFVNHVAHIHAQPTHAHREWEQLLAEHLAEYGAHTDWDNQSDPIWFTDEAHLAAFILKWYSS
jgi:hypothetical protein